MKRGRSQTGQMPQGQRQLRVAEQIRHVLAEILQRGKFHDPALQESGNITVTAVDIGPDLKHAVAHVMPLGGKNIEATLEALNAEAGVFRSGVASKLGLRYAPKITFRADRSFDEADRIEKLLQQERVRRDLNRKGDE